MTSEKKNVLLLMDDEHNYRCLGYRDEGEPVRTNAIDSLADSATVFEQAYCGAPLCTPSRMTMLSGREVMNCGAWDNGSVLSPELPTLPGTFEEAGYETGLVGEMHFGGNRQFNGFNHRPYGDLTGRTGHQPDPISQVRLREVVESSWAGIGFRSRIVEAGATDIPESLHQDRVVVDETISLLRELGSSNPDTPWFVCASFGRPHFPFTAPARFLDRFWPDGVTAPKIEDGENAVDHPFHEANRAVTSPDDITDEQLLRARAAYFAAVEYVDELIGDLLAILERDGYLDNTIVVFLSDHGEMAGEHGMWSKRTYHEDSTRVPFLIQVPEQRSGLLAAHRIRTPVSLLDLFPTLCGLTGIDVPSSLDGVDLSQTVTTGTEPNRGPVFVDRFGPPPTSSPSPLDHEVPATEELWPDGLEYRMVRDGRYKYVGFRNARQLLFDLANDPYELHNLASDEDISERDKEAMQRLRLVVDETMDFDETLEQRSHDTERADRYKLRTPDGTTKLGNSYQLPDGRIVSAETALTSPEVLIENPAAVFQDYPADSRSR